MTEKQKDTIKAFCEWLQENDISHMVIAADDEGCTTDINGSKNQIGAAFSAMLLRDADFRALVQEASMIALLCEKVKMRHKDEQEEREHPGGVQ